jgi:hypothetical protein
VSRPALRSTQPPVQWVPEILSLGLKLGRGVTLTTNTHLVPRSRMRSYIPPLPPSACVACSGTALALSSGGGSSSDLISSVLIIIIIIIIICKHLVKLRHMLKKLLARVTLY